LSAPDQPAKVIFAPDLIGASFIDADARKVVELWRNGAFKVVMNRELLVLHIKVLGQLGLSAELIRRWTLWLTVPERALFFPDICSNRASAIEICELLARETKTSRIVSAYVKAESKEGISWKSSSL